MKTYSKFKSADTSTRITINTATQGESLEQKLERIQKTKEPIKDGAPIIFTDRKEGIRASTNIRTDRMEVAIDGLSAASKSYKARREERTKVGKPEPTHGKDEGHDPESTNKAK